MNIRWMAVQYVGNTLRLPVVNEGDMDKPFGSSVVGREIRRIVVNPFSSSPQTFVPESEKSDAYNDMRTATLEADELRAENAKLRELLDYALPIAMYAASTEEGDRIRELMREVEL